MVRRILAIIAAALLVGTVALATLESPDMPLGQALLLLDRESLSVFQSQVDRLFAHWMWSEIILPVLVRPVWLLPAALGLICVGLSLTLPHGRRAERPGQRRF
jgi:hypothetical protein